MIKKITTTIAILISLQSFSQKVDSVALWNKHIDSVMSKTSIKDFQQWLYENATVKQYQEGKFVDLYNAYVQQQYNVWIAPKSQPKK